MNPMDISAVFPVSENGWNSGIFGPGALYGAHPCDLKLSWFIWSRNSLKLKWIWSFLHWRWWEDVPVAVSYVDASISFRLISKVLSSSFHAPFTHSTLQQTTIAMEHSFVFGWENHLQIVEFHVFFFRPSHPQRLLPTDGTLSNVLGRCESLVELTLVLRAEAVRPQIPPGSGEKIPVERVCLVPSGELT